MVKKLYEVEHDDNLHMADAKGVPDGKRSLLYDDDEHLKEHAFDVFEETKKVLDAS